MYSNVNILILKQHHTMVTVDSMYSQSLSSIDTFSLIISRDHDVLKVTR